MHVFKFHSIVCKSCFLIRVVFLLLPVSLGNTYLPDYVLLKSEKITMYIKMLFQSNILIVSIVLIIIGYMINEFLLIGRFKKVTEQMLCIL